MESLLLKFLVPSRSELPGKMNLSELGKAIQDTSDQAAGLVLTSVGEGGGGNGQDLDCKLNFNYSELEPAVSSILKSGADMCFPSNTTLLKIIEGDHFEVKFERLHSW